MSVNYGDVFKAKEAEGKIGYTQASNYTSLDTYQQPKEIFFEVTNCQLKCNFLPMKTSDGVFQPKTLRGRLFSCSM